MLDHRVVTLHPKIHGGLLADRGKETHRADLETHGIAAVRSRRVEPVPVPRPARHRDDRHRRPGDDACGGQEPRVGHDRDEPRSVRAAARGAARQRRRRERRDAPRASRSRRSRAPPAYDAAIVQWLQDGEQLPGAPRARARSHRRDAALRREPAPARRRVTGGTAPRAGGTACSSTAASRSRTSTTTTPTPRGGSCTISATARRARSSSTRTRAASASTPISPAAYQRALECDERSAFGGIVALNRPIDAATVELMVAGPQADVVIAPGYEAGAIEALQKRRKNTRILEAPAPERETLDVRQISGGFLVQAPHHFAATRNDWRVVTKAAPTPEQWRDIELAWRVCGHVKSNAIVLVKDGQAVGIGAGQQNRVESGEIAAKKAAGRARGGAWRERRVLSVRRRHRGGRRGAELPSVIQPGGVDARRGDHREGRRARARDGVHRRTALPALSAILMPGGTGRGGHVRRPRAAHQAPRRPRRHARARHDPRRRRRRERRLHPHEAGEGARRSGSPSPHVHLPEDATQARSPRRDPRVQRRSRGRRDARAASRRRRRSTTKPRCSRWIPTRTSTGCIR